MKSRTKALKTLHSARKLGNAMRVAGTNGRKTGELAIAAAQVIAKRMTLGAAAIIDPLNADRGEFARIIPEKTTAFAQAGFSWLQRSGKIAERMASFAASEMATASEAAVAMARCRTPGAIIAVQSRFATAWFARALSQSVALGSLALRTQGASIIPLHRAATANARRLSR
jgi:Phasin protein